MRKSAFFIFLFMGLSSFALAQESSCSDGVDNDGDGFIDCFDSDCANNAACDQSYIGKDKLCQTPPPGTLNFGMRLGSTSRDRTSLSYGRMAVGDLDRDRSPEMVTTHHNDKKVFILNGDDLTIKLEINTIGNPEYFDHAIANLDDDNCAEIFIVESEVRRECDSRGRNCQNNTYFMITSFDCNGNQLWRTQAHGQPFTIGLADFDHDGQTELYYKNEILDAKTGEILVPGSGNWNTFDSGPVAVDILPDAECGECAGLELVLGGQIFAVDLAPRTPGGGSVGAAIKKFNDLPGLGGIVYFPKYVAFGYVNSMTSIADYNLDGHLDVVMNGATSSSATSTTTVFFWDVYNNQFKTYQPRQPDNSSWPHGTGRINLADIDGDGKMNATFVSGARIYALKEDFSLLWQKTISEQTSGFTSTTVFDFNNDNAVEIVYRDEANLYIIDGKTGNAFTTVPCRSRTANDYPIVVDVDADGATEICVSCATNDNANINNNGNTPFGQIRTYKSSLEPWVSARKVWNQYAYFNVNVNDDLTIPQTQQKHHLVFSENVCGTGENRALNSFLNQSAILDSKGCKTYPSADVTFVANPSLLNIVPPTCPEKDFLVSFSLQNIGDLDLNGNFPVTFYNGDPRMAGAVKISTEIIPFNNFKIGDQIDVQDIVVTGTGGSFTLFAVLNDNGSTVPTPISLPNSGFDECNFSNNIVSVSVNPAAFQLSTSSNDHVKCGAGPSPPNGSVKAFKAEGAVERTVGYTFYWFDGTAAGPPGAANYAGSVRTGLNNGIYTVYARHDAFQCGSDTVQVHVGVRGHSVNAAVKVDEPYTNCNSPDGQLSVTPQGGHPLSNYTFEWFEGTVFGTSPTLSDSSVLRFTKALTYSVLVTELSSNCQTLVSGTVPDLTVTPTVTTAFTAANCAPANSGEASATVGGVTAGYTFYWYDGSTAKPSEDFLGHTYSNIAAGNYAVIAEANATGCRSDEAVVTVPPVQGITVNASISAQQTSCAAANGAASANVAGATAGYTFRWFGGNNTINEIGTGAVITGLAAGEYTVEATHTSTGCKDTHLITVIEDTKIPTVNASVVANQTDCLPPDGSVSATAAGSPGPYIYYWFTGNVGTPDTTGSNFKGQSVSGLAAGLYTVVAVDVDTRCASARGLTEVLDNTSDPVITINIAPQTHCNTLTPNGTASADIGGVTAGYKFRWFSGADTTKYIRQAPTLTSRPAGTYTVKAADLATGCFTTRQVPIINNLTIPVVTAGVDQNVTVCNSSNGQVSAHVGGMTAGFDFYWFNGSPGVTDTTSANFEGPVYASRSVGTYSVVAVNKRTRCISTKSTVTVSDNRVAPVIATATVNNTSCNTLTPNGGASADVGEVTAGYKFRWFSGADTTTFITQASTLTGRPAGTYTVKSVDAVTGCFSTRQVTIVNNFVTPVVTGEVDQHLTVCNASNGQVSSHVGGDTTGFDFYWFNGNPPLADTTASNFKGAVYASRPAGSFAVVAVNKATRCFSAKRMVNVLDNTVVPVVVAASPNDNTACIAANSNGSISANVAGVTTNHTFYIFRGQNTNPSNEVAGSPGASLSNLAAGIYTVQAVDNITGCAGTTEVTVNNKIVLPILNATGVNVTDCSPYNGSITATVSIGTVADYTFTWFDGNGMKPVTDYPGQTTESLTGLGEGTYTVTAFNDVLGCAVQRPFTREVINDPSTNITITDVPADLVPGAVCNDGTGQLGAQASSPVNTTGFTFSWFAGDKNSAMVFEGNGTMVSPIHNRISGISSGRYTVIALDHETGCQDSLEIDLPYVGEALLVSITTSPQTNCAAPDGSFEAEITPGPVAIGLGATQSSYRLDVFQNGVLIRSVPGVDPAPTVVSGLTAGNYTVMAVETQVPPLSGCASTANDIVIGDATIRPAIVASTLDNRNCSGAVVNSGSISLDIDAGADPNDYSFDWRQGQLMSGTVLPVANVPVPENAAINIQGGFYTVGVTNNLTGCAIVETIHINNDPYVISIPDANLNITHQTDCSPKNGSAEVTDVQIDGGDAGLAGFTFEWFENDGTTAVPSSGTAPLIGASLGFDRYFVSATHTLSNCQSTLKQFVVVDQTAPPVIAAALQTDNSNCSGSTPSGLLTIEVNRGAPVEDFTIEWFEGSGTAVALGTTVGMTAGANNETVQQLPAGTYTVRVTDNTTPGNSCAATSTFTIANDLPVIAIDNPNIAIMHQTDCAPVNGSAQVTDILVNGVATGSVAGFTFEWLEGDGTTVIAGSGNGAVMGAAPGTGNYFVRTRSAASNCMSPVTPFTLNDVHIDPLITLSAAVNNPNCPGSTPNGLLAIEVNGGAPLADFTIEWFEGSATAVLLGTTVGITAGANNERAQQLPAGTYTVRVTDNTTPGNSCAATSTFTIADNAPVISIHQADLSITHQTNCAPINGSATISEITVDGVGTADFSNYTFEWLQADGVTVIPGSGNGPAVASGLLPGGYFVRVINSVSGCTSLPTSFAVRDQTKIPGAAITQVSPDIACGSNYTGELAVSVSEGTNSGITAGYTVDWFEGKNTTNPAAFLSAGIALRNIQQGDYTVRVTDNAAPGLGCVTTATLPVQFAETRFSSALISEMQLSCAPAMDGRLTVNTITEMISGVSTTYSMANSSALNRFDFQWFDANMDPLPITPTPVNAVNSIENMAAGEYYVIVTNALGCSATVTSAIIDDQTIQPVITLENFASPAICVLPETSGYLQVSADNSLNFPDYTFEWFEGADDSGTLVEPDNATLGGIQYNEPLQYTVRVTRIATGCASLETYRFQVDTVDVHVLASAAARTNCLAENGSLFATTLDGNGNLYNYEWYRGPAVAGIPVYTTKEVTGVPIGQYTVVAVNPNHAFCATAPYTTRLSDERIMPAVIATQKNPLTYCDPANPNGVAVATVNNGVSGFTFAWFRGSAEGIPIYTGSEISGLAATTYVVRATDVLTGCENTAAIVIDNNPINVPEPRITIVSHHTNCSHPDGALSVSVDGNTADYFLQWYDGRSVKDQKDETGEFYRDLAAGFYTATATDKESGCVSDPVIAEILPFRENPEFDITTIPTNCEQNIGEATLVLLNDVQLLSVEWDIAGVIEFGTMLSDLPKGEFTVTATTYQECATSKTFVIEPEVLVFNGVSRNNDGANDIFEIACIQDFPNNNVKIFNRAGTLVYEANAYDNQNVFFDGVSNRGINLLGTDLPDGTYFYIIDKGNGSEPRTGYLELLR